MENKNNEKWTGVAALLSAALASVCCIGPLIAVTLGLTSLGFAAKLVRYRPYFLGLTATALAFGFYRAYRQRPVECEDGSCKMSSGSRTMKTSLWIVAVFALALATFPKWSTCLLKKCAFAGKVNAAASIPAGAQALNLKIAGMDCEDCTLMIKKNIEKIHGVYFADINFDAGTALVKTNGQVNAQDIIKAVAKSGYKAEIVSANLSTKGESNERK